MMVATFTLGSRTKLITNIHRAKPITKMTEKRDTKRERERKEQAELEVHTWVRNEVGKGDCSTHNRGRKLTSVLLFRAGCPVTNHEVVTITARQEETKVDSDTLPMQGILGEVLSQSLSREEETNLISRASSAGKRKEKRGRREKVIAVRAPIQEEIAAIKATTSKK